MQGVRLAAVVTLETLRVPPNNRLEALKGDRKGQWSIRINDQWRICFEWQNGSARMLPGIPIYSCHLFRYEPAAYLIIFNPVFVSLMLCDREDSLVCY